MSCEKVEFERCRSLLHGFACMLEDRLKENLVSVVLFGSLVSGNATRESDFDVLVIQDLESRNHGKKLEPVFHAYREFKKTSLWQNFVEAEFEPYFSFIVLSKSQAMEGRYLFLDMIEHSVILLDCGGFFKKRLEMLRERLRELGSKKVFLKDGSWYWDIKPDLVPGEVFEL